MKAKKILSTIAILFIALISGCAGDDAVEVVGVCPIVISTNPVDGASGVPLSQIVTATFNEEMNPLTINQSTFTVSVAGTPIAGTVTYSGKTATFTPASRLVVNTLYTGRITTEVKDVDGNALQTDYVWTFTTGLNPIVVSTDPANLAVDVALNKIITATFNMSMNPLTLNATTFTVKQGTTTVLGTITYAGTMVTFTPSAPLAQNTVYTATITKGATNLIGTELANDYVWTFTTGLRPTVILTDPLPNATGVALNKVISATFSVPMDPLTINATTFTVKQGATPVLGTITYTGTKASFTPAAPLAANTVYTATITTGAKNVAGTALGADYVWSFTTDVRPIVLSTDPANNAQGVPLNKVITATFNMPMNPLTLNAATFTIKNGAIPILGTISYTGSTVSFTPSVPLANNTVYTATVTTGAQNTLGTGLANDYVWSFTTLLRPIVVSTSPFNNETGVVLNKVITATFNMPMNPLTLNATTFTVRQGAIAVLGNYTYSGSTVSFTPSSPLTQNTLYTATITTGAQNTLGTGLATDYVWNFTTLTPIIPPTTGLFFGVFGGNAGITNQGLLTVVNGSIGTTAAASLITGFTDGTNGDWYTITTSHNGLVTNGIYADAPAPGTALKAQIALAGLNAARALYLSISPAQMPGGIASAAELGGLTLTPGIYTAGSSLGITNGDLVLDAQGDINAKWYFQAPSSLTVGDSAPSSVRFLNGLGNPNNVYWYVGSAAVINYAGGGVMVGNIIANSGVTLSSPANSTNPAVTVLNGRAISLVAGVTMVNTVINVPTN